MDSGQRVYVLLSVLKEKKAVFNAGNKILFKNSVTVKVTGTEEILFPSSISCRAYQITWISLSVCINSCSHKQSTVLNMKSVFKYSEKNPNVWNLLSRAQLKSESEIPLAIMSTMILDSLKIIRLRKEKVPIDKKSFWSVVVFGACTASKMSRQLRLFCWLKNPELQFCTEMGKRIMKQLYWACTAGGSHKCEKCHFAFFARQPFFCFLKSIWLWRVIQFDKSIFFLLHYIVHARTQDMESKNTWYGSIWIQTHSLGQVHQQL